MKTYLGTRTIDGLQVTVDGQPLPDHRDIKEYTNAGFEWGYPGDAPRQLALAILFDHLGNASAAIAGVDGFMKSTVALFDNEWSLTSAEIDAVTGTSNSA